MIRNSSVPMPENSRVVAGGKPVSTGTRNVAPNIAPTCWAPMPMVFGQLSRSSGATTNVSSVLLATGFQLSGITLRLHTMERPRARATGGKSGVLRFVSADRGDLLRRRRLGVELVAQPLG